MNELWKKYKKNIIIISIVICLCAASFCAGRYAKLRRATDDSYGTLQRIEQLQSEAKHLQSELELRISECDELRGQLDRVESGIDESIRTAGSIREEIGNGREQLKGSSEIIQELRKRFIKYENRIAELEEDLSRIKGSSSK